MKSKVFLLCALLSSLSLNSGAFAEVQIVDRSIGAKEPKPEFVPPLEVSTKNLTAMQRLSKVEQQVNNINQQGYTNQIDELRNEVQKLTGLVEEQKHQIEQLTSQVRNFYQDLDKRLETGVKKTDKESKEAVVEAVSENTGISSKNKKADNINTVNTVNTVNTANTVDNTVKEIDQPAKTSTSKEFLKEQQMYQTAIDLLPSKNYESVSAKLRDYLKHYPKGIYVANAHYWLGEINFLKKNYDAAEEEFKIVLDKYPKAKRIAEATFKLALVHQYQGRDAQSKQELKQVIKRYPNTPAAAQAKIQLEGN